MNIFENALNTQSIQFLSKTYLPKMLKYYIFSKNITSLLNLEIIYDNPRCISFKTLVHSGQPWWAFSISPCH